MNRMFAIFEREMRKFFRSPVLMIMSMMLPSCSSSSWATLSAARSAAPSVAVVDLRSRSAVRQDSRSL